jgi:hypothetical protein
MPGSANAQTMPQPVVQSRPTYHPPLAIKDYRYTDRAIGDIDMKDEYGHRVNFDDFFLKALTNGK